MVLEYHAVDIPWWQDLVTGVKKPLIENDGYESVPDTPGLGIELNEEYCLLALRRLELAENDCSIQGYADGVFWERNTLAQQLQAQRAEDQAIPGQPLAARASLFE